LESPEEFLGHLNDAFDVREIWVGEAFTLGKDRVGNVQRLQEIGTGLGFSVNAMPRVANDDEMISSSYIRDAVIAGNLHDGDQTSMKTARFLASQLERLHRASIGASRSAAITLRCR
jgi:FAD synthase